MLMSKTGDGNFTLCHNVITNLQGMYEQIFLASAFFNRPGVARAVLQTPLSLIN